MSRPQLLSAPNIPKPLHGLNPRTIMGRELWDAERQKVYQSTGFHCAACGVHKSMARKHRWLEAHEIFDIDYAKGRAHLLEIAPLCHFCHAFIHSGLTRMRARKREITAQEVRDIMRHGCENLRASGTGIFSGTRELCKLVSVNTARIPTLPTPRKMASWSKWRLVWNGKEYKGKFKSMAEWSSHYSRM